MEDLPKKDRPPRSAKAHPTRAPGPTLLAVLHRSIFGISNFAFRFSTKTARLLACSPLIDQIALLVHRGAPAVRARQVLPAFRKFGLLRIKKIRERVCNLRVRKLFVAVRTSQNPAGHPSTGTSCQPIEHAWIVPYQGSIKCEAAQTTPALTEFFTRFSKRSALAPRFFALLTIFIFRICKSTSQPLFPLSACLLSWRYAPGHPTSQYRHRISPRSE